MADKLTQQILDALTRAAAEPGGLPLYAGKADQGLFPNVAGAKPAAQKCLAEDLLCVLTADTKGKSARDLYTLTDKGWEYLLAAVNPKQVLEDFVRVLEARQGEVSELLGTARRMAESLQGLRDAVSRVLPTVTAAKMERPTPPGPPSLKGRGESDLIAVGASETLPARSGSSSPLPFRQGGPGGVGSALAILAYLADHTGPTDCALPELFRALSLTDALTIGEFHDCLRELHADGRIELPQWTGPLYALPEPQYALLIGHGIAYYASLKSGVVGNGPWTVNAPSLSSTAR